MISTTTDPPGAADGELPERRRPRWRARPDLGPPERIAGGLSALLAARLGINPFWLRMAWVLSALAGGLGIVLYVGLWLILVVGADEDRGRVRIAGAVVLAVGSGYLLGTGRTHIATGAPAVILLLVGLAVALWPPATLRRSGSTDDEGSIVDPELARTHRAVGARPARRPRTRRPPSMLGRSVLGLAVVTAAVGALVDQANGGRLHPEQWLGAAAAVCGLGMLIGVLRGRARWLIVPAALFAASGYVGGAAAERGISILHGQRYVDMSTSGDERISRSVGDVDLDIFGRPETPQTRRISVLFGGVRATVNSTAAASIDLYWEVAHGSAVIDGVRQPDTGSMHLGPGGPPDVVAHVAIWRGDLTLWNEQHDAVESTTPDAGTNGIVVDAPGTEALPGESASFSPTVVTTGVAATDDGLFLLGASEAMIDDLDHVILGTTTTRADGVVLITTSYGTFQLLPRGLLLTPDNELVDLHRWRAQHPPSIDTTATTSPATASSSAITTTTIIGG